MTRRVSQYIRLGLAIAVLVTCGCSDSGSAASDGGADSPDGDATETSWTLADIRDGSLEIVCGDGLVEGNEDCDGGPVVNGSCNDVCQLTCDEGYADCNSRPADGCEVSLGADGDHCGMCRRSCLGAPCIDGYCQPTLLEFGMEGPAAHSRSLGLHDGSVYYAYSGDFTPLDPSDQIGWVSGIRRMPTGCGGNAACCGSRSSAVWFDIDEANIRKLRFDDEFVYWFDKNDAQIERRVLTELDGQFNPDVEVVTGGLPSLPHYQVGSDYVYWSRPPSTTAATGAIERVPKSGGAVETFVDGLDGPRNLAIDENYLFVIDLAASGESGRLLRIELSTGDVTPLASTEGYGRIETQGADVLWLNEREGTVQSVSVSGGRTETIVESLTLFAPDFAVDDSSVYLPVIADQDDGPETRIVRVSRATGESEVLISTSSRQETYCGDDDPGPEFVLYGLDPSALVVDQTHVYWTEPQHHVLKVPK